jgi:ribosome biogenesis protein BMS1
VCGRAPSCTRGKGRMQAGDVKAAKEHHARQSGAKARKKEAVKAKRKGDDAPPPDRRNAKAFGVSKAGRAIKSIRRNLDRSHRRDHVAIVQRGAEIPPPVLVVVMGPPQTGKTTLIRALVKKFTRHTLSDVRGPITVVANKNRRITFVECPCEINAMVDLGKVADLVLLTIDASFGFEMETFEFLNVLQVHGFPRVMGVLTHLDGPKFRTPKQVRHRKKELKARFWVEVYQGAKLFYLSGLTHGNYPQREIHNLSLFLTRIKFRPLTWRAAHPYVVTDRIEDVTPPAEVQANPKCDRRVALFGFVRGAALKQSTLLHLCGCGDLSTLAIRTLDDPVPLPETDPEKRKLKRSLNAKETLLYAPMSDVGSVIFDRDAVYINVPHVHFSKAESLLTSEDAKKATGFPDMRPAAVASSSSAMSNPESGRSEAGIAMVKHLQDLGSGEKLDDRLRSSELSLFAGSRMLKASDMAIDDEEDEEDDDDDDDSDDEEEDDFDYDGVDSEEDEEEEEALASRRSSSRALPEEELVSSSGRIRRRAVFGDGEGDLAAQSRAALAERRAGQVDLEALVYGDDDAYAQEEQGALEAASDEEDEEEDFFVVKRHAEGAAATSRKRAVESTVDAEDTSIWRAPEAQRDWVGDATGLAELKNRFVTGDWGAGGQREARRLLGLGASSGVTEADDGEDEDPSGLESGEEEEVYGDFEDLETGQKFGPGATAGSDDDEDDEDDDDEGDAEELESLESGDEGDGIDDDEEDDDDRHREAQASLHAQFNRQYDEKKTRPKSEEDEDESGVKAAAAALDDKEEEEKEYLGPDSEAARAARRLAQDAINEEELAQANPEVRAAIAGHRAGEYVRIEVSGVPPELFEHFTASRPLILGGVLPHERGMSLLRLRLKRHRWSPRVLKNGDPLIFSIGWRRFQSIPIYSMRDPNERNRFVKYTPEHMHCEATIWGPTTPTNVGFLAYQTVSGRAAAFRVAATGTTLELNDKYRIVKKLKLVGKPLKIFRNTAIIRDMFNSELEVSKFVNAKIRTVSGIRGRVRKPVKEGDPGAFRAVFEDKILHSDLVFLRTWVPVEAKRFCNPVASLLVPASYEDAIARRRQLLGLEAPSPAEEVPAEEEEDSRDVGGDTSGLLLMRPMRQLRKEHGVSIPQKEDSWFQPQERHARRFNALHVPMSLQGKLPFHAKPKNVAAKSSSGYAQKRAVVVEAAERKARTQVQLIQTVRNAREKKIQEAERKRQVERAAKEAREAAKLAPMLKARRQERMKEAGMREAKRLKAQREQRGMGSS